jgi:hypothetical protein
MATALEQMACEHHTESTLQATLLAPLRTLFGWSFHQTLFVYAWVFILLTYLVLYYVVPISILNSSNGFRSGARVLISTLIIFSISVMTYVVWARSAACAIKRSKALYHLRGHRMSMPAFLGDAVKSVQSEERNRGREIMQWKPEQPI